MLASRSQSQKSNSQLSKQHPNERRKAARKVKSMLKESGAAVNSKKSVPAKAEAASGDESEDGGVKLDEEME